MFTTNTKKTRAIAGATFVVAAGLLFSGAATASADPVPQASSTVTSFAFTAPAVRPTGGNIRVHAAIEQVHTDRTPLFARVSCDGGSWARLTPDIGMYPNHATLVTELPASDSGKTCILTITSDNPSQTVSFPDAGPTIYPGGVNVTGVLVTRSRTGGL
ncbi:hypothetical protein B7R21_07050 [Subtercola boreus]|uniref:Secreted protein n=1 Tax=Subtercola boreus TaxID=120213 RepID=A0A3E0VXX3_9MICO|nr:hypothetical protein [Subtercola boreus]RFA14329.1 hypothetical protein B7R21_07050 [Subtercola boreus]